MKFFFMNLTGTVWSRSLSQQPEKINPFELSRTLLTLLCLLMFTGCFGGKLTKKELIKQMPPLKFFPVGENSDLLLYDSEFLTPQMKCKGSRKLTTGAISNHGLILLKPPSSNHVLLLDAKGKEIATLVAPGKYKLNGPLCFSPGGNIYATDLLKGVILKYSSRGKFEKVALYLKDRKKRKSMNISLHIPTEDNLFAIERNSGMVFRYQLNGELDVSFHLSKDALESNSINLNIDSEMNLYFTDQTNRTISKFSFHGEKKFEKKRAGKTRFVGPIHLAASSFDKLFALDTALCKVFIFSLKGKYRGSFCKKGSNDDELNAPSDIAVDSQGNLYICDPGNKKIKIFDIDGGFLFGFGFENREESHLINPKNFFLFQESYLFILERDRNSFRTLTLDGLFKAELKRASMFNRSYDKSLAFFSDNKKGIYAINYLDSKILRLPSEKIPNLKGSLKTFLHPSRKRDRISNIVFDTNGLFYFIESKSKKIVAYNLLGKKVKTFDRKINIPTIEKKLTITEISCDSDENFYLTDPQTNCITKKNADSGVIWQAGKRVGKNIFGKGRGEGEFNQPGKTYRAGSKPLLVADIKNSRIQLLNPDTGSFISKFGKKGFSSGDMNGNFALCADSKLIFHIDTAASRVQGFSYKGQHLFTLGQQGKGKEEFRSPFIANISNNGILTVINAEFTEKFGEKKDFACFRVQKLKYENPLEKAILALKSEKYKIAENSLTSITRSPRNNSDVRYYLAYSQLKLGRILNARASLRRAQYEGDKNAKQKALELLTYMKNSGF